MKTKKLGLKRVGVDECMGKTVFLEGTFPYSTVYLNFPDHPSTRNYSTWKSLRLADDLVARLPHGSGINGDWHIDQQLTYCGKRTNSVFSCRNTYSAMDEGGGYCHDYDFRVIVRVKYGLYPPEWEVLALTGIRERSCCGYGLREYLRDLISDSLEFPR